MGWDVGPVSKGWIKPRDLWNFDDLFFFFFFCSNTHEPWGAELKGSLAFCLFSILSLRGKAGSTAFQRKLTYKKL
jgi:hypothetical protein